MHQAAGNPLQYYHYGGDEVASTAWMGSPICQQFMQDMGFTSNNDLKRFFLETLVNVTAGACGGLFGLFRGCGEKQMLIIS